MIERTCENCGIKYKTSPSRRLKFCSTKCSISHFRKNKSGKNNPAWNSATIECKQCKKKKVIPKSLVKKNGNFCSIKCKGVWQEKHPTNKKKGFYAECENCGNKIYRKQSRLKMYKKSFCSGICKGDWMSKHSKGKDNNNWQGGVNPFFNIIRHSDKYNSWRFRVFKRDNFTCQNCSDNKGSNLEAHHIKTFMELVNEAVEYMPLLNIVDACMLYYPLWDISNGLTLCVKCYDRIKHKLVRFKDRKKK